MGYRSEVVYSIQPKDTPEAQAKWFVFLAEARNCPTTKLAMEMIDRGGEWADNPKEVWWRGGLDSLHNSILMEMEGVKWYDSYDEPKSFSALFDMIDQDYDEDIDAAYVRDGEEDDDIESRYIGDGWELVQVRSYYELGEGCVYEECDHVQDETTRRNLSTNLDKKRQEEHDAKIESGMMIGFNHIRKETNYEK